MPNRPALAQEAFCPIEHRGNFVGQMRAVPGSVAVICSDDGDVRSGLVATAWNSLSADPPMLLVCVNQNASAHDIIARKRAFSVNVIATGDTETVNIFSAQRGLSGKDRFIEGAWEDGPLGQPMYKQAVAAFECGLEASHAYGTHTIYIGKVHDIRSTSGANPLIYMDGSFYQATPIG